MNDRLVVTPNDTRRADFTGGVVVIEVCPGAHQAVCFDAVAGDEESAEGDEKSGGFSHGCS
jgi:hypothetical protein